MKSIASRISCCLRSNSARSFRSFSRFCSSIRPPQSWAGTPRRIPRPNPCSLLAALCLQQLGPHAPDIVLGQSAWILTDLEHRVASDLTRVQVNEVGTFVRPVEGQVAVLAR